MLYCWALGCLSGKPRPYEGLLVSLPVAVSLLVWRLGKSAAKPRVAIGPMGCPSLACSLLTVGAMGSYNWRVTGNPPSRSLSSIRGGPYAPMPLFLWQPPRPVPEYRHALIRDFYIFTESLFREQRSVRGMAWMGWHKEARTYWMGPGGRYLRLVLTIPLIVMSVAPERPVVTLCHAHLWGLGGGVAY